ncbi:hypothetical protein DY000_02014957 [Brassica cretica]|uniref:Gnk2-homologous domain-containing protein n=1 Tax=Brassica cretica TaxID=69181 RepID=A0ABQ7D3C1_BRACR|nr:hypothetical protein DY000_02014957 [Brassica cretica]
MVLQCLLQNWDCSSHSPNHLDYCRSILRGDWRSISNWHCRSMVLPIGALSTSIGSGASSGCLLVVSGRLAEGSDCGMCALIRAMSIFGNCTRNVRGAHRSMGAGGCRSVAVSRYRSMAGSVCRSILT